VADAQTTLPDLSTLDNEALRALVLAQSIEIDNLKLLVLKLKRMQFGRKSEKLDRLVEQLEFGLEDLETTAAEAPAPPETPAAESAPTKPARRPRQTPCRAEPGRTHRKTKPARIAAARCVRGARTFPRCWSTCRGTSR
jgi:hypothetical protein